MQVGNTIETASGALRKAGRDVSTWRQLDIPGHFIIDKVLGAIDDAEFVAMDITKLNFNVTFETAYALTKHKRVILTMDRSLNNDQKAIDALGIFDTIGYETYENSTQFAEIIANRGSPSGIRFSSTDIDRTAPLFPRHLAQERRLNPYEIAHQKDADPLSKLRSRRAVSIVCD